MQDLFSNTIILSTFRTGEASIPAQTNLTSPLKTSTNTTRGKNNNSPRAGNRGSSLQRAFLPETPLAERTRQDLELGRTRSPAGRARERRALLTGRAPRAGRGPAPQPRPPAARAWRGASAAGEGRGRAAPPLGGLLPLGARRGGAEQSGAAQPRHLRCSERGARAARLPAGSEARARAAAISRSASRRESRQGKAAGEGRGWEVGVSGPARAAVPVTWSPPAPGRAGGGSAERRERGPSARRSPLRGTTAPPSDGYGRAHGPAPSPAPPSAPIGRDAPFESRGGRAPLAAPAMARSALPAPRRAHGPAPA